MKFRHILWPALKFIALALALITILIPANRVSFWAYPILMGLPLVATAIRGRADREFILWATYTFSFVVFVVLRRIADDVGVPIIYDFPIAVDRLLGLGAIPTVVLQSAYTLGHAGLHDWLAIAIHLSYYLVPPGVGVVLWLRKSEAFAPYILGLAFLYLLGVAMHFAFPTAPPWLASQMGRISPVNRILFDVVYGESPSLLGYGTQVAAGNDVAAMPSLHAGAAAMVAFAARGRGRGPRTIAVAYLCLMCLSLVYLGEHYVIDLFAGGAVAWVSWRVVLGGLRRHHA